MANAAEVRAAAEIAAQNLITFDMEAIAAAAGSVISASLFGALAASETLPFAREDFEAAIRRSGRGVETSLTAFNNAYDQAKGDGQPVEMPKVSKVGHVSNSLKLMKLYEKLCARIDAFPSSVQPMAHAGLRSVVDFQDLAYGTEFHGL